MELLEKGISEGTHLKLGKLFQDMITLEKDLESQRKSKYLKDLDARFIFQGFDQSRRGEIYIDDYKEYFKRGYNGELPFNPEDV